MVAIRFSEQPARAGASFAAKFLEQLQSKGYYGFLSSEQWAPNVNLYETDGAYLVCVDLAGVEKEKIELEVIDNRLSIRGKRAVPTCPEQHASRVRVHLMEIDHGGFAREVELPRDVMPTDIGAKYRDGMLWIELPKMR